LPNNLHAVRSIAEKLASGLKKNRVWLPKKQSPGFVKNFILSYKEFCRLFFASLAVSYSNLAMNLPNARKNYLVSTVKP
jgi:hypothetical protein